jgi:hypothetical protein
MTNENVPGLSAQLGDEATAGQKKLLRLVYIMGIVLVLLFLGLIGGIIWKAARPKPAPPPDVFTLGLGLKSGDIRAVSVDGNTMVITTMVEIVVIDVPKRKVLLREPLAQ